MTRTPKNEAKIDGDTVRLRVAPGQTGRRTFHFGCPRAEYEERAKLLAAWSRAMRGKIGTDEIERVLAEAAASNTPEDLQVCREAVEDLASGRALKKGSALAPTFAKFADEWTSGRLRRDYPDHIRDKDHDEDKQQLRDYINPKIGMKRLPDVTLEDVERAMRALPSHLGPATRKHVAQCMRKVLSLAVYPGRHITANPIPREWMPKVPKSARKAKACLFPDEEGRLLACADVPLERRLAYGILAREGMRASELAELRWTDVDLERGRVRLDENKTDDPRAWALSPDVVKVLVWWKKRANADASPFVLSCLDLTQGPRWLRGKTWDPKTRHKNEPGDLRTAGVTRAELFERSPSRQPIRLHDFRALFVTVSLANGKTETWVTDRTGHKSSQMIATYTRQARTWNELELGNLQPMDRLLPEMNTPEGATVVPPVLDETGTDRAQNSSDCWTRTSDPAVNSRLLYQLS
jgi:integrase